MGSSDIPSRNFGVNVARALLACSLLGLAGASADGGESLAALPGMVAGSQGDTVSQYKNWLKVEGHYWKSGDGGQYYGNFNNRRRGQRFQKMFFSYPSAPHSGADQLVIAVDKRNPRMRQLMSACARKTTLPAMNFAENAVRSRGPGEIGPKPEGVPDYFEYSLKDVVIAGCPVVADAPDQVFEIAFKNIEWLNARAMDGNEPVLGVELKLDPAPALPIQAGGAGRTKSFVVSWFGYSDSVDGSSCPAVSAKTPQSAYYEFMSPEKARTVSAALAGKGGPNYENGQMGRRGPDETNVCLLPGIVKDPGHIEPVTSMARGFDLDGSDGTGRLPAGVCKHKNYTSDDGRTGIDNQLYSVMGCTPGWWGHKGYMLQYFNEQRRMGLLSIMVQISGIDNDQNDDNVVVSILYSKDPIMRNPDGSLTLADYTFRESDNPEYASFNTHLRGRIVNGVITTEPVRQLRMHPGLDPELRLQDARMQLRIQPNGSLKGVLGGYQDWRRVMSNNMNSNAENLSGFQCPGIYNALRRAADGMKDPVTGECNGLSSAFDIEGVPAYVSPARRVAQASGGARKAD